MVTNPGTIFVWKSRLTTNHQSTHISICVCTYKRKQPLKRLLQELVAQDTSGLFTYSSSLSTTIS